MKKPSFKAPKFSVAPIGEDDFLIESVEYNAEKNAYKVKFRMREANRTHSENYRLDINFQVNALGNMLRAAYNDDSLEEFDETLLDGAVGRQFRGEIVHRTWDGNTYAGINGYSYKPVAALYSFVKASDDVIHDSETIA